MEDILLQTLCRQLLPFLQVELLFSLLWVKILIWFSSSLFITIELGLELFFLQVELKGRPSCLGLSRSRGWFGNDLPLISSPSRRCVKAPARPQWYRVSGCSLTGVWMKIPLVIYTLVDQNSIWRQLSRILVCDWSEDGSDRQLAVQWKAGSLCKPNQPHGEKSRVTGLISMVSKPIVFF